MVGTTGTGGVEVGAIGSAVVGGPVVGTVTVVGGRVVDGGVDGVELDRVIRKAASATTATAMATAIAILTLLYGRVPSTSPVRPLTASW